LPDEEVEILGPVECPTCFCVSVPFRSAALETAIRYCESKKSERNSLCGLCEAAPAVKYCQDCDGVMCAACAEKMHAQGFMQRHVVRDLGDEHASQLQCSIHKEEKLSLYCVDCQLPVCAHCLLVGDHVGHSRMNMSEASTFASSELENVSRELLAQKANKVYLMQELDVLGSDLVKNAEAAREAMREEFQALQELMEAKKQQLEVRLKIDEDNRRARLESARQDVKKAVDDLDQMAERLGGLPAALEPCGLLAVSSVLAVEARKCLGRSKDAGVGAAVSANFRSVDIRRQMSMMGELDFVAEPAAAKGDPHMPQGWPPQAPGMQFTQVQLGAPMAYVGNPVGSWQAQMPYQHAPGLIHPQSLLHGGMQAPMQAPMQPPMQAPMQPNVQQSAAQAGTAMQPGVQGAYLLSSQYR
jgi:hypothetical protein